MSVTQVVYVAILRDLELSSDDVLTVQTNRENVDKIVKDYFGISNTKEYGKPAKYLGFTKIEYSEFEDDLIGYYSFDDGAGIEKVYLFNKILNEVI